MRKTKNKIFLPAILFLLFFTQILFPQSVLENYIKEGIDNNIVLKQKKISLERAVYSLKTATSYFFPAIILKSDYISGEGGRVISIPVGDMLNPVYQTLNQLTQTNLFPQISNVRQYFFPFKFYDVKIRTTMPIINTDLIFNREIQSGQVQLQEYEVDLYKRELIKEIKVAYFNYLSAVSLVKIYETDLERAKEGKRVNESMMKNGSGLPVYVIRAESEIESVLAKIQDAKNQSANAKRYFNFLLNKNLDSDIDTNYEENSNYISSSINSDELSWQKREELKLLQRGVEINQSILKMNKFFWIPKVNAFLDLGAQDQNWKFNSNSRYYLFGLQLDVPLFEAFRNQYKIDQSELDVKNAELNLELTEKQLNLTAEIAKGNLETAKQNYRSSLKQLEAAKNYYRLIDKGYKEGINTFIETVDARTQLTQAELLANINEYQILIASAKYERELAVSKINL